MLLLMESVKVWFALPTDAAYALQHASEPCLAEEAIFTKATWIFLGWNGDGNFLEEGDGPLRVALLISILQKQITRGSIGLSPFPSNSHYQDYYMFSRGFLHLHMQLLCGRGTTQWHLHVWFNRTIHNFLFASVIPKSGFRSIWYDEKLPHLHCSWPLHQRVFLKIKLLRSTLAPGKKKQVGPWLKFCFHKKQTFHLGAAWYFFNPNSYVDSISSWIFCMKLCGCFC